MTFTSDYLIYCLAKFVGLILRHLPINMALGLGRAIGTLGYYINRKHKSIAYANLKVAFAGTKEPHELKAITKKLFRNFGQNVIDIYLLPKIHRMGTEKFVRVDGKEHVLEALKQKKGVILLAMHFGSWEITSLLTTILGHPYKVFVKPQKKFSKLDELLNSYRECGGSIAMARGRGTRELIASLQKNQVVGIVADQGGRDGVLVNFLGRNASMSAGAIRIGLKLGVPICPSVLIREQGSQHHLILHPPVSLIQTDQPDEDIKTNVQQIITKMQDYIRQYPSEYMWFYKIWKYSNETKILLLHDGRVGHLRQSQTVAKWLGQALQDRGIASQTQTIDVAFKNRFAQIMVQICSVLFLMRFSQGRIGFLKHFLTPQCYKALISSQGDYVVSCGSLAAGLNCFLTRENRAKNICILKPGVLPLSRFRLVVLPQHDVIEGQHLDRRQVATTRAAPNLITPSYLQEQAQLLTNRFSHLKNSLKPKIGVLLGGETKTCRLSSQQIKILLNQIREAAQHIDAEILLTTSRRTSGAVENMVRRIMKLSDRCRLMIIANHDNVPEAVGGILGLSDFLVVSGDSISMISEAMSSGKKTVVFPAQAKNKSPFTKMKHQGFADRLAAQGHIVVCPESRIAQILCDLAKNKIQTKPIDDNATILAAVKQVI